MDKKKSFTMIELIIVIAVIGILAGIIFVASSPAKKKAKDARIQSDLLQIQNRAERIYLDEGNYDTVGCSGDAEIQNLCNDIFALGSSLNIYTPASLPATQYCAIANLASSSQYFCTDYLGLAKQLNNFWHCKALFSCYCDASFDTNKDGLEDCCDRCVVIYCFFNIPPGCGYSTNPEYDVDCDTHLTMGDGTGVGKYLLYVKGIDCTGFDCATCP